MTNRVTVAHEAEELMSVLGHELRSPLTAIRGAATLLLEAHQELAPEKVVELLAVIDGAASRMADRIEDVLVAGRLDRDRQPVLIEDLELSEVIADALEAARAGNPDRRLRSTGIVEGIRVQADRQRVSQVLRVLIDNALRFSPSGSSVEVRGERSAGMARIVVRDRGQGIAPSDRRRIFGRGVKLDPSGPGAGLGLYVVAGLLKAMKGETGFEPRAGGGSTFWFTLPLSAK